MSMMNRKNIQLSPALSESNLDRRSTPDFRHVGTTEICSWTSSHRGDSNSPFIFHLDTQLIIGRIEVDGSSYIVAAFILFPSVDPDLSSLHPPPMLS